MTNKKKMATGKPMSVGRTYVDMYGRKIRTRKDGQLDMRYKHAKRFNKLDNLKKTQASVDKRKTSRAKRNRTSGCGGYLVIILLALLSVFMFSESEPVTGTPRHDSFGTTRAIEAPVVEEERVFKEIIETPEHCKGEIEEKICGFDWDDRVMVAVAKAESGLNPNAFNGSNSNGTYDVGIFQINSVHGIPEEELFDVELNIAHAYRIWKSSGYTAWAAYNNGRYLQFMD